MLVPSVPPPLTVSFVRSGQRRQNRELQLRPHLICVNILLPGGPCPRRPTVMAGSRHPQVSGQLLERILSNGQCSLVCLLRPITTQRPPHRHALSFFEEAHRIGELDYVSTETDILRSQQKTTAVVDIRFSIGPLSCVFLYLSPSIFEFL